MKKRIALAIVLVMAALLLTGCGNWSGFDVEYNYHEAMLAMPDGNILCGEVQDWCEYASDMVQVKIDGVTYLVHSSDIVLMNIP